MLPGVGVSANELATVVRGSSAGPSKPPLAQAGEIERAAKKIALRKMAADDGIEILLIDFCSRSEEEVTSRTVMKLRSYERISATAKYVVQLWFATFCELDRWPNVLMELDMPA
jgi:hypothetical protein